MRLQLFLKGIQVVDREIALPLEELRFIKKLSFESRVKYLEQIIGAHALDVKGKYWRAIHKAQKFEIHLLVESKMNKKIKS